MKQAVTSLFAPLHAASTSEDVAPSIYYSIEETNKGILLPVCRASLNLLSDLHFVLGLEKIHDNVGKSSSSNKDSEGLIPDHRVQQGSQVKPVAKNCTLLVPRPRLPQLASGPEAHGYRPRRFL